MFILSRDEKKLINCSNVASIYIQEVYRQYANPNKWWEIRAMYPAVYPASSEDVLYDILDTYSDEEECKNNFDKLCSQIGKSREHDIIDMGYLWD